MGRRRQGRELALQILFQVEITCDPPAEVLQRFWESRSVPEEMREFAQELVLGTVENRERIDGEIAAVAEHWRLERMAVVDRNVLRMAIFELIGEPETPPAVVIDEAIEIARKYGSEDSAPFINGILDSIRRRVEKPVAGT
jgi:N utilization substance protein B